MPAKVLSEILYAKERYTLADLVVQLVETARNDILPNVEGWEFYQYLLVMKQMYEMHVQNKEVRAMELAQAASLPIWLVRKLIQDLLELRVIEQRTDGYVLSPAFFNSDRMMKGFELRSIMVSVATDTVEKSKKELENHTGSRH
jgi:hypothetical protein